MPVNLQASGILIVMGSIVRADDGNCDVKGIKTPLDLRTWKQGEIEHVRLSIITLTFAT
jgi:hypothetical protein